MTFIVIFLSIQLIALLFAYPAMYSVKYTKEGQIKTQFFKRLHYKVQTHKTTFIMALEYSFYVALLITCVAITTSIGWAIVSTALFYFGVKYVRRYVNSKVNQIIEEQ